jgi:hypothetical protein
MPVPDFSPGEVLTAAAMDSIGLWLVKTDTITSGTSKEITGAFNSNFKNYLVVVSQLKSSGAPTGLRLQMGTTALGIYYWAGTSVAYGTTTVSAESQAGGTSINTGFVSQSTVACGGLIELQSPQLAERTSFQCRASDIRTGGTGARNYNGFVNDATAYTSFTLSVEGGVTFTSCDVRVYGYRN